MECRTKSADFRSIKKLAPIKKPYAPFRRGVNRPIFQF
jgi:hypothetical protein